MTDILILDSRGQKTAKSAGKADKMKNRDSIIQEIERKDEGPNRPVPWVSSKEGPKEAIELSNENI